MKKILPLPFFLLAFTQSAFAAVPPEVSAETLLMMEGGVMVAGGVLTAIVAINALRYLRCIISGGNQFTYGTPPLTELDAQISAHESANGSGYMSRSSSEDPSDHISFSNSGGSFDSEADMQSRLRGDKH